MRDGVASGEIVNTLSKDEDSSGMAVDDTTISVEDTATRAGDSDGEALKTSFEVAILLDCSDNGEELMGIRLETRERVANLERIGFTFTRIGRRLEPGRVRT